MLITSTHIDGPAERIYHGANFTEMRVPKDQYFSRHWKELSRYAGKGDMSAPTIAATGQSPTLMHEVYLQEYADADVIIHDFPFTVDYDLFLGLDNKPRIYNAHNCETELYKKLHDGADSAPIHELVQRCEQKLLNHTDAVWYCSPDDLTAFRALAPEASFEAVFAPNGLSLQPLNTAQTKPKHAVFMGSGHLPNAEAAQWIVQQLAPALPDWQFDLFGTCLSTNTQVGKNVKVHGLVDAKLKQKLLTEATVALNPMQSGSGSNVKVFDYFAHGTAVLSTPMGLRGIDAVAEQHVYVAELEQFASQLQLIAKAADKRDQIAQQGWQWARDHYSWQAIATPLLAQINTLAHAAKKTPKTNLVLALNDYDSYANIGGGCVRTQGLYQAVAEHYPVVLLCFSPHQALATRQAAPNVHVIEVPKTNAHLHQEAQDNSRCSPISVNDIVASQQVTANPWLQTIYMELTKSAHAIVAEHVYMTPLPLQAHHRFIYSSHNHEGDLKKRLLPERGQALADQVVALEKRAVATAISTLAVSESDAQLLSQTQSAGPIFVVPNGALPPQEASAEDIAKVEQKVQKTGLSAVFLGSAHPPNVEAAKFIVNQLAPACPQVQFHLVGSVCHAIHHFPANVVNWDVVDESLKTAIMSQVNLALNPVISGSGSNIKLADFMGNGLYTLSTPFGVRGYSESIAAHYQLTELDQFAHSLKQLDPKQIDTPDLRAQRRQLFDTQLSMYAQGQGLVDYLQQIDTPRKRVLFVTYRYTSPTLGGAEQFFEELVKAADNQGDYLVDVVAPEVSSLRSEHRFREEYLWDDQTQALTGLRRTRFQRFAVDGNDAGFWAQDLADLWRVHPAFERGVYQQLAQQKAIPTNEAALAWGWGHPETSLSGGVQRWAFSDCAVHVPEQSHLTLQGEAVNGLVLSVFDGQQQLILEKSMKGKFTVKLTALPAGAVRLFSSVPTGAVPDPRPLAFRLIELQVNDQVLDLGLTPLCTVNDLPADVGFDVMDKAAKARARHNLTDVRGPWSSGLERYLAHHIHEYDAVVTHNVVFRPAVAAVHYAHQAGVPSLIVPHAHLDDDYYHFPDLMQTIQHASVVFGSPKAACGFYQKKGANAQYLPSGIDVDEPFNDEDIVDFDAIYANELSNKSHVETPFVLVLGRKSGAKGYQHVIDAVNGFKGKVRVVLIGPDDDGVAVNSPHATYLGRQSREVVRGALQRCLALVTMSRSESFGIVLLEAWLAHKPVIANTYCAAFHDMAVHEHNALLVEDNTQSLAAAIERLLMDPDLAQRLGDQGHELTARYDWSAVGQQFLTTLGSLIQSK